MNGLARPLSVGRKGLWSWGLFDFDNSSFATVVLTFVFATYFTQAIAADVETGTALWGTTTGIAGFIIAILSPVCGAIADQTRRRKPWLAFFTVLCVASTAALWFAAPAPGSIPFAMVAVVFGLIGFEVGLVFYNSMLPDLTTPDRIGRLSGLAWGMGYGGGLLCLAIVLVVFIQADPAPFNLDTNNAEHIRATALFVAGWITLFTWPLFAFTPDTSRATTSFGVAVKTGLHTLITTIRNMRQHANCFRFLLARMFYTDGVNTLFAFGGVFAAGTFGMTLEDIIILGIGLNVTAGLGAAAFGWVDDAFGSKKTLTICLGALTLSSIAVLLAQTIPQFWFSALLMSTFVGPVQAASRTFMARLAPTELRGEMFGLFAVSGKITSFMGPFAVGALTLMAGSQRIGMASILVFLILGLFLLQAVKDPSTKT